MDKHIGMRLRQRRQELRIEPQQLADRLEVDTGVIEAFEAGRRRINAGQLLLVARELSVPLAYFFDGITAARHLEPEFLLDLLRKLK